MEHSSSLSNGTTDKSKRTYQELKPPVNNFKEPEKLTKAQIEFWRILRNKGEFIDAPTRREQIGIAVDHLNVKAEHPLKWTQESIGDLFGTSRTSIIKQYNKFKNGVKRNGAHSILTDDESVKLGQWIDEQILVKEYPTLDMIGDYISVNFKKEILPNTLWKVINERFTSYKFVDAVPLEEARYNVNPTDIDEYYRILEEKISGADFRFFFNIDETGEDEYVDTHSVKVLVTSTTNPETVKLPVSRKQKRFTIIHTICTDGTFMNMYIVVPRVTIESDIFTLIDKDKTRIVYQKNGFVTNEVFKDFWDFFIKQMREKRKACNYVGLAIVIMDNHRSHHNVVGGDPNEKVTFVPAENLLIIWLVPHSSEQTQPLDLGIFSVQKRETQKQKKDPLYTTFTNSIINAISGMEKASTTKNIISAFRAAGIVRRICPNSSYSVLSIDRSQAHAVRHWRSTNETPPVTGTSGAQLRNHNPEFPRFRIISFGGV